MTVTGQTQLLFWSFLPLVSDRNVTVLASAVAGISPPLCTACGIEPFAVAAPNQADTIDLGFVPGTTYVLTYLCSGLLPTPPAGLPQITYVLLNRLDTNATVFADEDSQAFRAGAGGLPGNTNSAQACFRVNNTEAIWASAVINQCALNRVAPVVNNALCGLDTRFETSPAACAGITNVDTLAQAYLPDTDIDDHDAYADYTGNGRRIITIPIVDAVSAGTMTVLGFRQFLVMQSNPADSLGRFQAMYIGSVAPVKQGRFDGCQLASGTGKGGACTNETGRRTARDRSVSAHRPRSADGDRGARARHLHLLHAGKTDVHGGPLRRNAARGKFLRRPGSHRASRDQLRLDGNHRIRRQSDRSRPDSPPCFRFASSATIPPRSNWSLAIARRRVAIRRKVVCRRAISSCR